MANIIYGWIFINIFQEKLIQPYLIQKEPLKEPVFAVRLRAILNIFEAELCFNPMCLLDENFNFFLVFNANSVISKFLKSQRQKVF